MIGFLELYLRNQTYIYANKFIINKNLTYIYTFTMAARLSLAPQTAALTCVLAAPEVQVPNPEMHYTAACVAFHP